MKKLSILIFACLYLGLSSGVVMNLHYCMGQLSSVEYGYEEPRHCGECGMEEKDGCCDTEFKVVKLQDSHQWTKAGMDFKNSFTIPSRHIEYFSFTNARYDLATSAKYSSPPDRRTNTLYTHICNYRI